MARRGMCQKARWLRERYPFAAKLFYSCILRRAYFFLGVAMGLFEYAEPIPVEAL